MEENFLDLKEKEMLKKMLSRIKKTSTDYYKPFNEEERKILLNVYTKCLYNDIGNIRQMYTKSGILVNEEQRFNRIVIGDYGAFFEFEKQDILCNIFPKFNSAPKRNVCYIWHQTTDETKVYQQVNKVSYADYKPGKYYISAADLYFKIYDKLMPLSLFNEAIEEIEKDNNLVKISFEKEQAQEIITTLNLRINIIETGDYLYSKEDVLKFSEKYRLENGIKIKEKTEEQQELLSLLKRIKDDIYKQF